MSKILPFTRAENGNSNARKQIALARGRIRGLQPKSGSRLRRNRSFNFVRKTFYQLLALTEQFQRIVSRLPATINQRKKGG
jgi:hypothetical protein